MPKSHVHARDLCPSHVGTPETCAQVTCAHVTCGQGTCARPRLVPKSHVHAGHGVLNNGLEALALSGLSGAEVHLVQGFHDDRQHGSGRVAHLLQSLRKNNLRKRRRRRWHALVVGAKVDRHDKR